MLQLYENNTYKWIITEVVFSFLLSYFKERFIPFRLLILSITYLNTTFFLHALFIINSNFTLPSVIYFLFTTAVSNFYRYVSNSHFIFQSVLYFMLQTAVLNFYVFASNSNFTLPSVLYFMFQTAILNFYLLQTVIFYCQLYYILCFRQQFWIFMFML